MIGRRTLQVSRDAVQMTYARARTPELAHLLSATAPYSLLSQRKRIALYRAAQEVQARHLPGDLVEMGAHRGGGAGMFVGLLDDADRRLHLFDRWGEVPQPADADGAFAQQNYGRSVDLLAGTDPQADARRLMSELRIPIDQVGYHPGWLDDSLPGYDGADICLAHVDVNLYESTRSVFTFFERRLAEQAVVVLDDWGEAWPGVRDAYAQWSTTTTRTLTIAPGNQQAVVHVGP